MSAVAGPIAEPTSVHLATPLLSASASDRTAHRCSSCGYGAVLVTPATHACPMCRSTRWLPDDRVRLTGPGMV